MRVDAGIKEEKFVSAVTDVDGATTSVGRGISEVRRGVLCRSLFHSKCIRTLIEA